MLARFKSPRWRAGTSHVRTSIRTTRRRTIYGRTVRKFTFFLLSWHAITRHPFRLSPRHRASNAYLLKSDSRVIPIVADSFARSLAHSFVQGAIRLVIQIDAENKTLREWSNYGRRNFWRAPRWFFFSHRVRADLGKPIIVARGRAARLNSARYSP